MGTKQKCMPNYEVLKNSAEVGNRHGHVFFSAKSYNSGRGQGSIISRRSAPVENDLSASGNAYLVIGIRSKFPLKLATVKKHCSRESQVIRNVLPLLVLAITWAVRLLFRCWEANNISKSRSSNIQKIPRIGKTLFPRIP